MSTGCESKDSPYPGYNEERHPVDEFLCLLTQVLFEFQLLRASACSEARVSPCGLWYWPRPFFGSRVESLVTWVDWLSHVNKGFPKLSMPSQAFQSSLRVGSEDASLIQGVGSLSQCPRQLLYPTGQRFERKARGSSRSRKSLQARWVLRVAFSRGRPALLGHSQLVSWLDIP